MTIALDHASAGNDRPAEREPQRLLPPRGTPTVGSGPTPLETSLLYRVQELEALNRYLSEFVNGAAHDLRTPLHVVDQLVRWIAADQQNALSPESAEHLAQLRGQVQRMDRLVVGLLEYALADSPARDIEMLDTDDLLSEVLALIRPPSAFTVERRSRLPCVKASRSRMTSVLMNLITNAVKHHDRGGGVVRVSALSVDQDWVFSVCDDGPGIPRALQETAFGLFRTDRPERSAEGSGIGLALVRRIVRGWGGDVWIESVGRGTTVRFTIGGEDDQGA